MTGDVIVKFDGKDIKESRDLPELVASLPVGKEVDVVVVRKGQEITKTVKLGRLEDGEKAAAVANGDEESTAEKKAISKAFGMEFRVFRKRRANRSGSRTASRASSSPPSSPIRPPRKRACSRAT